MSNVYARNQKDTELKFLADAIKLMETVTEFALSNKNIPKSARFPIGFPMIHAAQRILQNLYIANNFYPQLENTDNEEDAKLSLEKAKRVLEQREKYQCLAKAECFYLQSLIVNAQMKVPTVKIKSLEKMSIALADLIDTILAWIKANRIYPPKEK